MTASRARRPGGRWWAGPAIGLVVALAVFPLLRSSLFQSFEQKTVDARLRLRGRAQPASEVVVCAIDARSIDRLGQWPWSRAILGDLIRKLRAGGARAIALDEIFSEPARCGPGEDEAIARAISEAGNVVLGFYLTSEGGEDSARGGERVFPSPVEQVSLPPAGFPEVPSYAGIETNIPVIARASTLGGHFVVRPDSDGTVRHYSLILMRAGEIYPALALRAVQTYLGGPPISVRPRQGRLPLVRVGDVVVPASEKGELWINWIGPYGSTFSYVSAVDVLEDKAAADSFRDKLVFIGATETGIGDITTSPFDPTVPGIEVHATVADNLLHRRFILDGAAEAMLGMLALFVLGPFCAGAAALVKKPQIGAAVAAGALGLYALGSQWALSALARHLYLFVPLLAGALAFTVSAAWRNVFAEAKARQIRRTFQQFVSEAVVEEMLRDPDKVRLGGEKRDLTVLFSDIRGFTSMSEKMAPEQVVSILNEYLTPMTRILIERGGTLDKYMGDAIMAFYGAPVAQEDHPVRACAAALAMKARLAELNGEWSGRGIPAIAAGIGINTGPMSVGNMGSELVFDYTVIGDNVNLGSRLEGLTKLYGVTILVSERTESRVREAFLFREIDLVRVKGKGEAVRIYELVGAPREPAVEIAHLAPFAAGLERYRACDFDGAEAQFRQALALRPGDGPSTLYLSRIESYRTAPPPPGWDGAATLTEK